MAKASVKAQAKILAKKNVQIMVDRYEKRRELWKDISSQEDFERFFTRLKKLYGKMGFTNAVKTKGFVIPSDKI